MAVSLSDEQKKGLQLALAQPFRYLGKGTQFYAFESADGKYVLKFLKHKHLHPWKWLESVPLPSFLRRISKAKIQRRKERVQRLFSSCKLAYDEMSAETGYLFIHLNRTPALEMQVTLIDPLGLKHVIELDQHEYVVQKKAVLVKEAFACAQSEAEVRHLVDLLIEALTHRADMGIIDRDRAFVQNIAFDSGGSRALFIDPGQFCKASEPLTKEIRKAEMKKRLGNLRMWTETHFPQYVPVVDDYLKAL